MPLAVARAVLSPIVPLLLSAVPLLTSSPDRPSLPDAELPIPTRTNYAFSLDGRLRPEMGAEDLTSAFRVAFRGKDLLMDRLEVGLPPVAGIGVRLAELVVIDTPLSISTQTFAHEMFGHGGRVRELGGAATYVWKPPFPYSSDTSFYVPSFARPLTFDEQALIAQGGLALEGFQRQQVLRSAFASGRWAHGDAMDYFAWSLHLAGYGALQGGDVTNWTQAMADRAGVSQADLQRRFLISAALTELLDPVFLYSVYAVFDRFLVFGERSVGSPAIQLGPVALGISTHLEPTPWGCEYRLDVFARTALGVAELSPRVGTGPGGSSAGLAIAVQRVAIAEHLRLGADADLWVQPQLNVFSEGVVFGTPAVDPSGEPTLPPASATVIGVAAHVELTFEQEHWFAGVRAGAKTAGLSGIEPIAPALESVALLGIRL